MGYSFEAEAVSWSGMANDRDRGAFAVATGPVVSAAQKGTLSRGRFLSHKLLNARRGRAVNVRPLLALLLILAAALYGMRIAGDGYRDSQYRKTYWDACKRPDAEPATPCRPNLN